MKKVVNITVILGVITLILAIGVKAATSIAANQVTYNNTTVQEELDELVDIAKQCPDNALCSKVKVGDYVSMTPTETVYIIPGELTGYIDTTTGEYKDQAINPSELNLWRVIDIKNDGAIEMVSEYVSSTNVYFYGQEGYLKFISTLNTIASQYGNSKYTIGSRYIGYNGQTATITDTSKFTTKAPWSTTTDAHGDSYETLGGGDIMCAYDIHTSTGLVHKALETLKANKVGTTTATAYWLGSRNYVYISASDYRWNGRYVNASGSVALNNLYYYSRGWLDRSNSHALRPIVTLRSDITSYTGSGTSDSPYVLP